MDLSSHLPISAHVAYARVCRQLYVLCASHALVQATVGVGTVIIVYIGVPYSRGGGATIHQRNLQARVQVLPSGHTIHHHVTALRPAALV